MLKKLFILTGRAGAGKSTCLSFLEEMGYKKIVTYTTRTPRNNEVNGVDYHFVSYAEFSCDNNLILKTVVAGNNYAVSLKDIQSAKNALIILDPHGIKEMEQFMKLHEVAVLYFDISKEESIRRMKQRGDNIENIRKRLSYDQIMFSDIYLNRLQFNLYKINAAHQFEDVNRQVINILQRSMHEATRNFRRQSCNNREN